MGRRNKDRWHGGQRFPQERQTESFKLPEFQELLFQTRFRFWFRISGDLCRLVFPVSCLAVFQAESFS
jgi:hypothetical protein